MCIRDSNRLLDQIDDLIKEVSSLKEALLQKGESLSITLPETSNDITINYTKETGEESKNAPKELNITILTSGCHGTLVQRQRGIYARPVFD